MLCCLLAFVGPSRADGGALDPRLAGVDLRELGAPVADAAERFVRAHPPAGFATITAVVLAYEAGASGESELVVDVVGRRKPLSGRRRARRREAPPEVARLALRVTRSSAADQCVPAVVHSARELRRWSFGDAHFTVRVSTGALLSVLEAPEHGYRHVFPIGVGAIDTVRRPGHVTSLTPATEDARLDPRVSVEVASVPAHFRGLPYLPFRVPSGWRDAHGAWHETLSDTRVGFHIFMTYRFIRGYVSRGCVVLREADLAELADAVYFGHEGAELSVHAEPLAEVAHPMPLERGLYFALSGFGPPEAPTWRVRGGLYVTEKVLGPPPGGLIDVYLDVEQRLRGPVMASR